MEDPDDPALQDECARRLFAYAAELRAEQQRQSDASDASRIEGEDEWAALLSPAE